MPVMDEYDLLLAARPEGFNEEPRREALEHASVRQYCKAVRVPAIGANFVSLAEQAVKENHTHIRYLEALLAMECEERDRHAIGNRIRDAQLPRMKTLEEFDFAQAPQIPAAKIRELAEGGYIERKRTGGADRRVRNRQEPFGDRTLSGRMPPETARAIHHGGGAGERTGGSQTEQPGAALMARWQKYELIALDEVGYVPLADIGAEFLFQVISERAERAALIVTTNLPVLGMDNGVSESALVQSSAGSDDGPSAHH